MKYSVPSSGLGGEKALAAPADRRRVHGIAAFDEQHLARALDAEGDQRALGRRRVPQDCLDGVVEQVHDDGRELGILDGRLLQGTELALEADAALAHLQLLDRQRGVQRDAARGENGEDARVDLLQIVGALGDPFHASELHGDAQMVLEIVAQAVQRVIRGAQLLQALLRHG